MGQDLANQSMLKMPQVMDATPIDAEALDLAIGTAERAELSSNRSALPTRRLGRTSMHITRVGLGAWAFGGSRWASGWGAQDDGESIDAIRRALDYGINWIDTAPIYGLGHSEAIVRRALHPIPADRRPYVFTKCGVVADRDPDRRS